MDTGLIRTLGSYADLQRYSNRIVSLLVSHCGEYPCECKKKYSRQISQIVANNNGEWGYECNSSPIAMFAK